MASVVMLPSGRFRAFARVRDMKDDQTFDRRADAQAWGGKTEDRMRSGKWQKSKPAKAPVKAGRTVEQAFELYRQSQDWLGKEATTRRVEIGKQRAVVAELGSLQLAELTRDDVVEFLAKRRKHKPLRAKDPEARLSGTQLRLELAALSSMCNYGVEQKWIAANPTRDVKRPKSSRRTGRLDDELIGSIMDHDAIMMDSKAYTFFRILFTSVCRPGELAGARKTWLRADPPQIHVPRTKNEDARSIILPVNNYKMLLSHLHTQDADCPYLFGTRKLSKQNPGWSPYNYATVWKKVAKDLGLGDKGVVPYLARHEGISRLFERTTLSDGQIAGLSGHRSAQALWHYKHLRNEHQRPIVDALDKMISDAIDRAVTPAHPSEKFKPGQMLTRE